MTKLLHFITSLIIMTGIIPPVLSAQNLTANFTAKECIQEVYRQGFDSEKDLEGWTLQSTNTSKTWKLGTPDSYTLSDFSSINPQSKYSLIINYDAREDQNEVLISPNIQIKENYNCQFYTAFDGVYIMYANFTIEVLDVQSNQKEELFNAFKWAQESGHERPKWLPFSFSLEKWANKTVQFIFTYKGINGDDVAIDDFIITSNQSSEDSKVTISEGEQVHFTDNSTGNPTAYQWTFEGGEPSTSTQQNPVVTYNAAGTYSVKLVVSDGTNNSQCERKNFVEVKIVTPTASFALPEEGYLSPYTGLYVPLNTDITFKDQSKNKPTKWLWTLPGTNIGTSELQNPTVQYSNIGTYSVRLEVSNNAGNDNTEYQSAIQAGGSQNIWNVEMDETQTLGSIDLSFYGYYGGSNWLGMVAFGERFHKPLVKGSIDEVEVFFDKTQTVTPDTAIVLSITKEENGLPGEVLASTSVPAKDLAYSESTWVPTKFRFDSPVTIDEAFYITVSGIPNNSNENGDDAIVIASTAKRPNGSKSTVYHLLNEEDENYQPTGETKWYKNSDEFLSFAIAPHFTYETKSTNISSTEKESDANFICPNIVKENIELNESYDRIYIYNVNGQNLYTGNKSIIDCSGWSKGIYLIKAIKEGKIYNQKIVKQ